jgi:hypothetical protein
MRRLLALGIALPCMLAAQGVRVSGVTTLQLVELRPLVTDSALASTVPGTGDWRTSPDGVPALCAPTSLYCRFERSGSRVSATPILQDLSISGWGWIEGLSLHADVRARTQLGGAGAFTYPRANDHFDVLDAYAELERGNWRGRLGRQWVTGGLGVYDYDGANAVYRHDAWSFEGWGGRALLAGLNEPYTTAQLAAVETIVPQQDGYIFGARARFRPDALSAASVMYQRVLVADRSGLYSERVALDESMRRFGLQLDAGLTYDLSSGEWNEGRARIGTGGAHAIGGSVELRHSRPFFELWTIWGAFAPVPFDEARGTIDWRPRESAWSFSLHGAYRKHADAFAGFDLRTNGWRAGGDAIWLASDEFSASASYDVDIASGAASEDGRIGARWNRPSGLSVGAEASVTQSIYEFRVGTGRIFGALLSGAVPIRDDFRLIVDGGLYQHALSNRAAGPDWTQRRLSMRLEWTMGGDPGMRAVKAP